MNEGDRVGTVLTTRQGTVERVTDQGVIVRWDSGGTQFFQTHKIGARDVSHWSDELRSLGGSPRPLLRGDELLSA